MKPGNHCLVFTVHAYSITLSYDVVARYVVRVSIARLKGFDLAVWVKLGQR